MSDIFGALNIDVSEEKDDRFEPFELPKDLPQLDQILRNDSMAPISDILFSAPAWHPESMASSLIVAVRGNLAVRSAIMLALELARQAELGLRKADDIKEVKFMQGQIKLAETFTQILITAMAATEAPEENDDVPHEE